MKLIKFKTEYSDKIFYCINDILINNKLCRTQYDSDFKKIITILKSKDIGNMMDSKYIIDNMIVMIEIKFDEIEELLELIPEEFL